MNTYQSFPYALTVIALLCIFVPNQSLGGETAVSPDRQEAVIWASPGVRDYLAKQRKNALAQEVKDKMTQARKGQEYGGNMGRELSGEMNTESPAYPQTPVYGLSYDHLVAGKYVFSLHSIVTTNVVNKNKTVLQNISYTYDLILKKIPGQVQLSISRVSIDAGKTTPTETAFLPIKSMVGKKMVFRINEEKKFIYSRSKDHRAVDEFSGLILRLIGFPVPRKFKEGEAWLTKCKQGLYLKWTGLVRDRTILICSMQIRDPMQIKMPQIFHESQKSNHDSEKQRMLLERKTKKILSSTIVLTGTEDTVSYTTRIKIVRVKKDSKKKITN